MRHVARALDQMLMVVGLQDQVPNGCKAGITFSVVASQLPVQGHLQQAPEKYEHERIGQKKYPQQA
jgi:hypothetical protein